MVGLSMAITENADCQRTGMSPERGGLRTQNKQMSFTPSHGFSLKEASKASVCLKQNLNDIFIYKNTKGQEAPCAWFGRGESRKGRGD